MATTVRLPVTLLTPQESANQGNAYYTVSGLTAYDAGHWELKNGVSGNIFGLVHVPHNLAATPNASLFLTCAANATTGNTVVQVKEQNIAAGASFNPASLTAETAQTITVPATAYQRFDVHFPTSGSLGVTPVADDVLLVQVFRDGSNASDTLAVALWVVEAVLQVDIA